MATEQRHNRPHRTVVRLAAQDDLSALTALHAGLSQEDSGRRDPFMNTAWVEREGRDYFATVVNDADSVVLVADDHARGVGYLVGRFSGPNSMRTVATAVLESMYVRQDSRDRRVGTTLVQSFLDWAREQEAGRVAVTAYVANEGAVRFYQRFGLRPRSVTLDMPLSTVGSRSCAARKPGAAQNALEGAGMSEGVRPEAEMRHLQRCVELAEQALAAGDEPFGSVLVSSDGNPLSEGRNEVAATGDRTRHPEFELARWAAANMTAEERAGATVFTSGEHCPMCSAAHGWVGLGRIVYAHSSEQLAGWLGDMDVPAPPVRMIPIREIVPGITVEGPVPAFTAQLRELHRRFFRAS